MACWPKNRTSYRSIGSHPYVCALKVRQLAKNEARFLCPIFAEIDCEILQDSPNEPDKPSWLITETGEAYEFVVERMGLEDEEVEVQMERIRKNYEIGTCQSGENGRVFENQRSLSSNYEDSRALLTILCHRRWESSIDTVNDSSFLDGFDGIGNRVDGSSGFCNRIDGKGGKDGSYWWKFGRRFKLPLDACPEGATAEKDNGALTVVVPRKSSLKTQWLKLPKKNLDGFRSGVPKGKPAYNFFDACVNSPGEGVQSIPRFDEASFMDANNIQMRTKINGVMENASFHEPFESRRARRYLDIKWIDLSPVVTSPADSSSSPSSSSSFSGWDASRTYQYQGQPQYQSPHSNSSQSESECLSSSEGEFPCGCPEQCRSNLCHGHAQSQQFWDHGQQNGFLPADMMECS